MSAPLYSPAESLSAPPAPSSAHLLRYSHTFPFTFHLTALRRVSAHNSDSSHSGSAEAKPCDRPDRFSTQPAPVVTSLGTPPPPLTTTTTTRVSPGTGSRPPGPRRGCCRIPTLWRKNEFAFRENNQFPGPGQLRRRWWLRLPTPRLCACAVIGG